VRSRDPADVGGTSAVRFGQHAVTSISITAGGTQAWPRPITGPFVGLLVSVALHALLYKQPAVRCTRRRSAAGGIALRVGQHPPVQHTLRCSDRLLVLFGKANLLGQPPLTSELLPVKPRICRAEPGTAMDFILHRLVNREDVALLAKLDPNRWPDTLCQSEIGIRVEQNQRQRLSSPCRAAASGIGMSMIC
jgi:hypothetical protein